MDAGEFQVTGGPVLDEVLARIDRHGPLPFAEVMGLALYHPGAGFYAAGGVAGRRGDFLTSPEVGPLFGAVIAAALDTWWAELGHPDPFVVVEAGAGRGALARTVLEAAPACLPALSYVLVERSASLRARHGEHLVISDPALALPPGADADDDQDDPPAEPGRGPRFVSLADLPAVRIRGVVLANELLDNLPVQLLERTGDGWSEVRVGSDDGRLVEHRVPAAAPLAALADRLAPAAPTGGRIPVQSAATDWLRAALGILERGRLVLLDYADTTASLAARPPADWLRTYRAHERGAGVLEALGTQDVTCEVAVDQLARVRAPALARSQAEFLRAHGIDDLVEEGRRIWAERGHLGDLVAMKARSRVREAEALLDPDGLGAFHVLEWVQV